MTSLVRTLWELPAMLCDPDSVPVGAAGAGQPPGQQDSRTAGQQQLALGNGAMNIFRRGGPKSPSERQSLGLTLINPYLITSLSLLPLLPQGWGAKSTECREAQRRDLGTTHPPFSSSGSCHKSQQSLGGAMSWRGCMMDNSTLD